MTGTTLRSIEEVAASRKKSHYTILVLQIVICCLVSSFVVRLANQNLDNKLSQVSSSPNMHINNLPKSSKKSSCDNSNSSVDPATEHQSQVTAGEVPSSHGGETVLSPWSPPTVAVPIDTTSSSNA